MTIPKPSFGLKDIAILIGAGVASGVLQSGVAQNAKDLSAQKTTDAVMVADQRITREKHADALRDLQATDLLQIEGQRLDRMNIDELKEQHRRIVAELRKTNEEIKTLHAQSGG